MQLNSSLRLQTYLCRAMMYRLLRTVLFYFPPEAVHYFSMNWLKRLCSISWIKKWLQQTYGVTNPALAKKVFGLSFTNPVGLGAGFDKNALYLHELEVLGFGAVEIGTVTHLPKRATLSHVYLDSQKTGLLLIEWVLTMTALMLLQTA